MNIHSCSNCALRAKHDRAPKSLLGRLWRWHIRFCPGWKRYLKSLSPEERSEIQEKYDLPKPG